MKTLGFTREGISGRASISQGHAGIQFIKMQLEHKFAGAYALQKGNSMYNRVSKGTKTTLACHEVGLVPWGGRAGVCRTYWRLDVGRGAEASRVNDPALGLTIGWTVVAPLDTGVTGTGLAFRFCHTLEPLPWGDGCLLGLGQRPGRRGQLSSPFQRCVWCRLLLSVATGRMAALEKLLGYLRRSLAQRV